MKQIVLTAGDDSRAQVQSVLLLTDGLANEGIKTKDGILGEMRKLQAPPARGDSTKVRESDKLDSSLVLRLLWRAYTNSHMPVDLSYLTEACYCCLSLQEFFCKFEQFAYNHIMLQQVNDAL